MSIIARDRSQLVPMGERQRKELVGRGDSEGSGGFGSAFLTGAISAGLRAGGGVAGRAAVAG
jgi:hypothetical protein